jgi:hypothetical protein
MFRGGNKLSRGKGLIGLCFSLLFAVVGVESIFRGESISFLIIYFSPESVIVRG